MYVVDLAKGKGPLPPTKLKQIRKWIDDDWESNDIDRDVVKLIGRLLDTVEALQAPPKKGAKKGSKSKAVATVIPECPTHGAARVRGKSLQGTHFDEYACGCKLAWHWVEVSW